MRRFLTVQNLRYLQPCSWGCSVESLDAWLTTLGCAFVSRCQRVQEVKDANSTILRNVESQWPSDLTPQPTRPYSSVSSCLCYRQGLKLIVVIKILPAGAIPITSKESWLYWCKWIHRSHLQQDKNIYANLEHTHTHTHTHTNTHTNCQMKMTFHTFYFNEIFYIAFYVW